MPLSIMYFIDIHSKRYPKIKKALYKTIHHPRFKNGLAESTKYRYIRILSKFFIWLDEKKDMWPIEGAKPDIQEYINKFYHLSGYT